MDLAARFAALDSWLAQHASVWRARPFVEHRLPWEQDWPQLAHWLRQQSLAHAEQAHTRLDLLDAPDPFARLLSEAQALSRMPDWCVSEPDSLPEALSRHMPGRKWQQVQRFAQVTQAQLHSKPEHWLDWCAGKGHLGRMLAWQGGQPLTCLEIDPLLGEQGVALSQSLGIDARHLQADVLDPSAWALLQPDQHVLALHACGQLHMTLLQQAVAHDCAAVALSPCCYNRITTSHYQPLSAEGRAARLKLSRDDLGLPLQSTHTAGQRSRRLRDQSMAWRLAFDLWQREARGVDRYLPTPSRPESALSQGMPAFCRDLANYHQLHLPEPTDWPALEQRGWQRLAEVRNLELVQGLFQRPLEIWLLLDRALFMQQAGYQVQLGTFCPSALTPRNLLLLAERNSAPLTPSL